MPPFRKQSLKWTTRTKPSRRRSRVRSNPPMNPALRTAATGMAAQQTRTEVIANNLANVNTTGFKRSRAQFEDLLYQTMQGPQVLGSSETNTAPAIQIGRGTHLTAVSRLHSQGALESTGRSLDVAIDGDGFFPITMPSGVTAY